MISLTIQTITTKLIGKQKLHLQYVNQKEKDVSKISETKEGVCSAIYTKVSRGLIVEWTLMVHINSDPK
jgi:hypothetical protein